MFKLNLIKLLYVTLMALFLTSCSSQVSEVLELDSDFELSFFAENNINPDDSKIPSPVIIRMYELHGVKAFEKANFIDLYERDAEILGNSLITQQILKALKPGEQSNTDFVLSKETKFVGLYVEFLEYENAKYKLAIPIEKSYLSDASAKVLLSGNTISLIE